MAFEFYNIQDGNWSDSTIWTASPGAPSTPTAADTVHIRHRVTIDTNAACHLLRIENNGSLVGPGNLTATSLTVDLMVQIATTSYAGGEVRLDGVTISTKPFIGASGAGLLSLQAGTDGSIIIDDTGMFNASTALQDIKPEGCGRAYTRKVSNTVRYLTLTVRIKRGLTSPYTDSVMVASLYRLAEGPSQVLAYNGSCIIKGYIESIAYDQASVGTEYHVLKVTVAEGQP